MNFDLTVTYLDQSGSKSVRAAINSDLMPYFLLDSLINKMSLPSTSPDGQPMTYALDHKEGGMRILDRWSFADAGIRSGDHIIIYPEVLAGCFSSASRVRLASGRLEKISKVRPGLRLLTYDIWEKCYNVKAVKQLHSSRHKQYVIINKNITMSLDQTLYKPNNFEEKSCDLLVGDTIMQYLFGEYVIRHISIIKSSINMFSIEIDDHNVRSCYICENLVVGDYGLKNETLDFREEAVFLSYSETDSTLAHRIYKYFMKNNVHVFFARISIGPGQEWERKIRRQLLSSKFFIILLSNSSIRSKWVTTEWGTAWALNKEIIPILKGVERTAIPDRLKRYQCLEITDNRTITKQLKKLLTKLKRPEQVSWDNLRFPIDAYGRY